MTDKNLTVKIKGKDTPVVVPYNVLLLCCDLFQETILGGGAPGVSYADQQKIFSYLFGKVDNRGKIIEEFNLADLDNEEEVIEVLVYLQEKVTNFFMKYTKRAETLTEKIEKEQALK